MWKCSCTHQAFLSLHFWTSGISVSSASSPDYYSALFHRFYRFPTLAASALPPVLFLFTLSKGILPVDPDILQLSKVLEVQRSVLIAIERQWRVNLHMHRLLFNAAECATHEAVIP